MDLSSATDIDKNSSNSIQKLSEKQSVLPPWLFLHEELNSALENANAATFGIT